MIGNLFKKTKYITVSQQNLQGKSDASDINLENKPSIPDGMWVKCKKCGSVLYNHDLKENYKVCSCGYHFRLTPEERIKLIIDKDTFEEFDTNINTVNPLDFKDYEKKIQNMKDSTGLKEAVVTGKGKIDGIQIVVCIMDSFFMMGSMGSVVGEKITRAIEKATNLRLPLIIFTTSGGARMQEGMFSLMQMAKVSAALKRFSDEGLLYITVLTDPTTGGVTASFAMLGDIIISEPGALIGFAGKRVIEQTTKQKLPEGFQRAEFLLEHGFIDKIVPRKELKITLKNILFMHVVNN
ncbi:acetyl-CoA carboxylase, carboxyltransferase subunit beta [Clostridium fermenticellae]|uniref:acetyl-CoA carboxylase, carboxyltransferase subunit beta n=1 Tax=Clostridium fermenticellae TaxID=2068654 RepID=UPI0018F8AA56|nr:acetyl-CoA carboxylase, carboxyltransferase subunit beta [Clostridium fermenticellae]